ncbi:MAG: ATP-binding protein [Lachnospiraceae bacterium]|nr:ATP-binding protein [Lachnospiraceae bacterium]
MTFLLDMIYFITVLLFGVAIGVCLSGVSINRRNFFTILCFCALDGLLQISILYFFGMDFSKKVYPISVHLPLILFLVFVLKRPVLNAVISVLSAYLCCQIPWWCGHLFNLLIPGELVFTIVHLASAVLVFYLVYRYLAEPTDHFMNHSRKSALLIGTIPLCYYLFDYSTTIYTGWLYSGNKTAVQFIPSVLACFYFIFIIVYYRELTLQEEASYQAEVMRIQLKHAASALEHIQALQNQTVTYRHDMRHHFNCLQALADTGEMPRLKEYIHSCQSDLDNITPKKFCQNEIVNLILTTYNNKASACGIVLDVQTDVPNTLSFSDTRLCAILSNALENALHATSHVPDKHIQVYISKRNSLLLIQVRNPFEGHITFEGNIPISTQKDHGLGTRSIAQIVNMSNGQYEFFVENQLFTVRVLLPLSEYPE